ncbi:MAG TPA: DUF5362 family protein [Chitinophagaceae bacterium]|jgi:hypothetical protein|nr:DUF5362 family protein [Chitinophagaceae bacterium]
MEENQQQPLFGLSIDQTGRAHLSEAARWAKFLSIVGFILCGLLVLVGIFAGAIFSSVTSGFNEMSGMTNVMAGSFTVIYLVIAAIYFFPCLFLNRFATKMKAALAADNQELLNTSFQNLKIMFRYVGILTIIILAFYGIIILFALLGAGLGRM